jgi:hypothetical protein
VTLENLASDGVERVSFEFAWDKYHEDLPRTLERLRTRSLTSYAVKLRGVADEVKWWAKTPDWMLVIDPAARERALGEIARAGDVLGLVKALPSDAGIVASRDGIEFAPPIRALDLSRIFGWGELVGRTHDVHQSSWHLYVQENDGYVRPAIGGRTVTALFERRPTGGEVAPMPLGGTHRASAEDMVRYLWIG